MGANKKTHLLIVLSFFTSSCLGRNSETGRWLIGGTCAGNGIVHASAIASAWHHDFSPI
jgi:hypothetical protein